VGAFEQVPISQLGSALRARLPVTRPVGPLVPFLASVCRDDTLRNFDTSSDPDGRPWAPLKGPAGRRPLVNTGLLRASVGVAVTQSGGPQGPVSVTVGSNNPVAAVHQFGAVISLPARARGPGEKPWVFTGRDGRRVFTKRIRASVALIPARRFLGAGPRLLFRLHTAVLNYFTGRPVEGA
jgi:phage gpG-like protein